MLMAANRSVVSLIRAVVKEDPQAAIVLAEILGPPVSSGTAPPRLWDG